MSVIGEATEASHKNDPAIFEKRLNGENGTF